MKLIEFKSSLINAFKEMDEENEVPTASTKDLIENIEGSKSAEEAYGVTCYERDIEDDMQVSILLRIMVTE